MSTAIDERAGSTQTEETTRHRVQLDFSPQAYEKLNTLRNKAEVRSNAELVRNALRLYEWFLDQRGKKFQVVEGDKVKEVELIF